MASGTKIEWTEATWNPVTGCTPISPGCAHCYARRMAKRLAGRCGYPAAPNEFDVTLRVDRLDEPLEWRKPRRVFVCSMSDLFHENVPFEFIWRVFRRMEFSHRHTFQVLTKRPERMLQFLLSGDHINLPLPNVWLGVTAENQEQADKRIPLLLQTPAAARFVSVEPMLGPVDLRTWRCECGAELDNASGHWRWTGEAWQHHHDYPVGHVDCSPSIGIDWIIAGGETGPGARPMHPDWVRSLRDQCQAAGVPFFFKSWGDWAPDCLCGSKNACRETDRPEPGKPGVMFRCGKKAAGRLLDGREWSEYPEQEQP